jgi:hypothetical protein
MKRRAPPGFEAVEQVIIITITIIMIITTNIIPQLLSIIMIIIIIRAFGVRPPALRRSSRVVGTRPLASSRVVTQNTRYWQHQQQGPQTAGTLWPGIVCELSLLSL